MTTYRYKQVKITSTRYGCFARQHEQDVARDARRGRPHLAGGGDTEASAFGNAFSSLKNGMLLHERVEVVQKDVERLSGDLKGLNGYLVSLDKRVVRIETMIEMSGRP